MNGIMKACLTAVVVLALAGGAQAAVNINFADTWTDDADTNTPGQVVGGISGTSWNAVSTADEVSLVDATGAATSVTVDLGKETGGATEEIDWAATGFVPNDLGIAFDTGIYDTNARSAIFVDDGAESEVSIGARVSGLDAGTWDFYLTGRNTNNNGEENGFDTYDVFAATVAAGSGTTDYSDWSIVNTINNDDTTDAWIDGTNYAAATLTVGADEDVVLIAEPTQSGEARGFINTLQIVPEPATMALLGLGGLALLRRKRG